MPARALPLFDTTPLRHPVWWLALAVLLVNDRLLKGHGIVPSWLTGKLSDFAFLLVAPVVLAALLPLRLPWRRTIAVVAVTGLFVGTDLSPALSDAVVALAAKVGLSWRLWPDPTDLAALSVLPATVWLLRVRPRGVHTTEHEVGARPLLRERAGVVLGALACIATSSIPGNPRRAFFVNRTNATVDVRVTWVLGKVDCAQTPEALAASLDAGKLDEARTLTFTPGDVVALAGPWAPGASPIGDCALTQSNNQDHTCVAAILESADVPAVVMIAKRAWQAYDADQGFISCSSPPSTVSTCKPRLDPRSDPGPDALSLVTMGNGAVFQVAAASPPAHTSDAGAETDIPAIRIAPVDAAAITARPAAFNSCRVTRDAYHTAMAETSCTQDSDCARVAALGLPGEAPVCELYVNKTAVSALETAAKLWETNCLTDPQFCYLAQPAACHAGRCEASCPGVSLPLCPPRCSELDPTLRGLCGHGALTCLDDDGNTCSCPTDKIVCQPAPPVSATCPLTCLPVPTAGSTN